MLTLKPSGKTVVWTPATTDRLLLYTKFFRKGWRYECAPQHHHHTHSSYQEEANCGWGMVYIQWAILLSHNYVRCMVPYKINIPTEENITGGSVVAKMKYGILPLPTLTLELCEVAKSGGVKCPIPKTMEHIRVNQTIPSYVPSVSMTILLWLNDSYGMHMPSCM